MAFCANTIFLRTISKQRFIFGYICSNYPSYSVYRTLLSESKTRMEQYKRQRVFQIDRLQAEKAELFKELDTVSSLREARQIASKLITAFHCAQSKQDCAIVEHVLSFLMAKTPSQSNDFSYGANVMRMYHYLNMPDEAFAAYKNQDFGNFFKDNTCHLILMDLLYKNGHYSKVVDVYFGMEKFNIDCTTIAFGSLYHINTTDSLAKCQSLLSHTVKNHTLSKRGVLFAAMHAVNQAKPDLALETLKYCKPDIIARNIELMNLCLLSRVKDVLSKLANMEHDTNDISKLWDLRIYHDAWQAILTVTKVKGTNEEKAEFEKIKTKLEHRGVLSHKPLDVFLNSVICGDDDYKRQRAKRIIHRTPSGNPI